MKAVRGPRKVTVSGLATVALCVAWMSLVTGGAVATWRYQTRPGPRPEEPATRRWPDGIALQRAAGKATIVMFAHPKCPCTRASVAELRRAAERLRGLAEVIVLFGVPRDGSGDWETTSTWESAASVPGARVVRDQDGAIARRLGATTSGHVAAFDAEGALVFEGGITSSRGHEGESDGGRALVSAVRGAAGPQALAAVEAPTYGCELVTP